MNLRNVNQYFNFEDHNKDNDANKSDEDTEIDPKTKNG